MKVGLLINSYRFAAGPSGPPEPASHVATWWADDITGLSDGDRITSWFDRSNTYELEAVGLGLIYDESVVALYGRPAAFSGGTGNFLKYAGTLTSSTQGVVVAVIQFPSGTGTRTIWSSADEASTTRYIAGTTSPGTMRFFQRNNDTLAAIEGTTADTVDGYIAEFSSNGTAYEFRYNNAVETLSVLGGSNNGDWFGDTSARDNFTVGGRLTSSASWETNGHIAYVMVADEPLSSGDRTALYDFLSDHYGITL